VFVGHGDQIRVWSEENWIIRENEQNLEKLNSLMETFNL
jgi:DNA-binding transcriptional regulator/RsmH inhibitor MraZ